MELFESLNPYQKMQVVIADDPQALVSLLQEIKTPIKIVAIVPYGSRQAAYIMGDVRSTTIKKTIKKQGV